MRPFLWPTPRELVEDILGAVFMLALLGVVTFFAVAVVP